jgi:hypothetical protein
MKTPKEKAEDLIVKFTQIEIEIGGKFDGYLKMQLHDAKQCASICVDEIILALNNTWAMNAYDYWQQVKEEIEKL